MTKVLKVLCVTIAISVILIGCGKSNNNIQNGDKDLENNDNVQNVDIDDVNDTLEDRKSTRLNSSH